MVYTFSIMGRPRKKHFAVLKTIFLYLILPLLLVVLPLLFSVSNELSPAQADFRRGTLPTVLAGDYFVEHKLAPAGWYGKSFDAESNTGSNIYQREDGSFYLEYVFNTSVDYDLRNPKQKVIMLRYEKPFFLSPFISEIVEYNGELIGKTYISLPLKITITSGHFQLKKFELTMAKVHSLACDTCLQ